MPENFDDMPVLPDYMPVVRNGLCTEVGDAFFFPDPAVGSAGLLSGKFICSRCLSPDQCLEAALGVTSQLQREYGSDELAVVGIWGGLSERDRQRVAHLRSTGETGEAASYIEGVRRSGRERGTKALIGRLGLTLYSD